MRNDRRNWRYRRGFSRQCGDRRQRGKFPHLLRAGASDASWRNGRAKIENRAIGRGRYADASLDGATDKRSRAGHRHVAPEPHRAEKTVSVPGLNAELIADAIAVQFFARRMLVPFAQAAG